MLHMLAPQMPQAKSAKPEQFVDLSFLNEVENEEFFTEMAKHCPAKGIGRKKRLVQLEG
jgi:hypothetical protein